MSNQATAGARFRAAVREEQPLQVVGAINANHALLAQQAGFRAIYLSGGGVAAGSLGLPDLGISGLEDVLVDVRRITDVCELPLLVDVDTGFGPSAFNVARTVKSLIKAGAGSDVTSKTRWAPSAAVIAPNKEIVSRRQEMVDRVKAAADAQDRPRLFPDRADGCDGRSMASMPPSSVRIACAEAGADAIFAEADVPTCPPTSRFVDGRLKVPVLANITEFGATPAVHASKSCATPMWASASSCIRCRAFRADEQGRARRSTAAVRRRRARRRTSSTLMQTRAELYEAIGYHDVRKQA